MELSKTNYIIHTDSIKNFIVPIYESDSKEKLINAREKFYVLRGEDTKTKYNDWIKERITKYKFEKNIDFIGFSLKNEKLIGVRPTERKKGYATQMLSQALKFCKDNLGLKRVME